MVTISWSFFKKHFALFIYFAFIFKWNIAVFGLKCIRTHISLKKSKAWLTSGLIVKMN